MTIDTAEVRKLTEVGFLAAGYGLFEEAATLLDAVRTVRPDSEFPLIGLAVLELTRGTPEEAVSILRRQALPAFPNSSDVKSFLGLALFMVGHRQESRSVLEEVTADADASAEALALARAVLEQA